MPDPRTVKGGGKGDRAAFNAVAARKFGTSVVADFAAACAAGARGGEAARADAGPLEERLVNAACEEAPADGEFNHEDPKELIYIYIYQILRKLILLIFVLQKLCVTTRCVNICFKNCFTILCSGENNLTIVYTGTQALPKQLPIEVLQQSQEACDARGLHGWGGARGRKAGPQKGAREVRRH